MDSEQLFYSSLNYQKLFNLSPEQADELAAANLRSKSRCADAFESRMATELANAQSTSNYSPRAFFSNSPSISEQLIQLKRQYGNILIALFHFGEHRHIPVDLASHGVSLAAPIAGKAFWPLYRQRHILSDDFAQAFNLLEVEDKAVGKQLLKATRRGLSPALYIDGNMGPDGVHVTEGSHTVDFFGSTLRAKAGIKRLSDKLKLPIVPVFATVTKEEHKMQLGQVLLPVTDQLQNLYTQLQTQIAERPQDWEFITCLHRWLETPVAPDVDIPQQPSSFRFNHNQTRLLSKNASHFLVSVKNQKAVKIPTALESELLEMYQSKNAIDLNQLKKVRDMPDNLDEFMAFLATKELVKAYSAS